MELTANKVDFICKYCTKGFRKESTLLNHLCESKRRAQQEKASGVQIGLQVYLKFYEAMQGSAKLKTYADFSDSAYYSAFVKFGWHLVNIQCISIPAYVDWLLKQNKKLDNWCRDEYYEEWLVQFLKKENPNDALIRSFSTMQKWADEIGCQFNDYFRNESSNKVCHEIKAGRISPWIIFNSDSGVLFLDTLNDEQLQHIYNYIDPEYWRRRFKDYLGDTEYIKHVAKEANL